MEQNKIPVLMNAEMVRAIRYGRKTQTRRPIAPAPDERTIRMYAEATADFSAKTDRWYQEYLNDGRQWTDGASHRCPFGKPGDQLWVREKLRVLSLPKNGQIEVRYEADGYETKVAFPSRLKPVEVGKCIPNGCHREASRISLGVVDIRVERVHAITLDDVRAEGITEYLSEFTKESTEEEADVWRNRTSVENYRHLWDSIYYPGIYKKPTPFKWDANPWVWVIEFQRVQA